MSDQQEFMDLAQASSEEFNPSLVKGQLYASKADCFPSDTPREEEEPVGRYVQYALNGPGFTPATKTVDTLPPGIYSVGYVNDTPTFIPENIVTDNLVRLPDSKSDEVISEIDKFWTLKERFNKFGYSHKRGFLLWGPPGSGKTSTLSIVMKKVVEEGDIVVLAAGIDPGTLARMLGRARDVEPNRRITVVFEDIDTIIRTFGETEVLALLDGEASIANVVYIATTNYPENLDGRIVNRPSRFDKVVKIGMPNADARRTYLESRGLGLTAEEMNKWVELTEEFSISHIKELVVGVMCFGNDLEAEVERLDAMKQTPKSTDSGRSAGFGKR